MEKKLEKIEKLIENLAISAKDGFGYSEKQFNRLEKELISTKLRMEENFLSVHQELKLINQEISNLNTEVDRLGSKLDLISKTEGEDTAVLFKDMEKLKIKVSELDKQLNFLSKKTT